MPKAFGTEQETQAGNITSTARPVNVRSPRALPGFREQTRSFTKLAEDAAEEARNVKLGGAIADGRRRISQITNPVERNLLRENVISNLTEEFGAKSLTSIMKGINDVQQTKTRVMPDGTVVIVDEHDNPIGLPNQPDSGEEVVLREVQDNGFAIDSALPKTAENLDKIVELASSHIAINPGEVIEAQHAIMDFVQNVKRSSRRAGGNFLGGLPPAEAEKKASIEANRFRSDFVAALGAFRSNALQRAVSADRGQNISPQMIRAAVDEMANEMISTLRQSGTARLYNIDLTQFRNDANAVSEQVFNVYKAAAEENVQQLELANKNLSLRADIIINREQLNLVTNNKDAARLLGGKEVVAAMSHLTTSVLNLQTADAATGGTVTATAGPLISQIIPSMGVNLIQSTIAATPVLDAQTLSNYSNNMKQMFNAPPSSWAIYLDPMTNHAKRVLEKVKSNPKAFGASKQTIDALEQNVQRLQSMQQSFDSSLKASVSADKSSSLTVDGVKDLLRRTFNTLSGAFSQPKRVSPRPTDGGDVGP